MIFGLNIMGIILGISLLALSAGLIILGRKTYNERKTVFIGGKNIKGNSATFAGIVLLISGCLLLILGLLLPFIML